VLLARATHDAGIMNINMRKLDVLLADHGYYLLTECAMAIATAPASWVFMLQPHQVCDYDESGSYFDPKQDPEIGSLGRLEFRSATLQHVFKRFEETCCRGAM
jgi:hypothetical protein